MNAVAFWKVIGEYNSQTLPFQFVVILLLTVGLVLSYTGKVKWCAKLTLGVAHLFIGIVFFGIFGTEPIQTFFALPLFISCGILFLYESIRNKDDKLNKPNKWQGILLILYVLYPLVSYALGNTFPEMVTFLMPCPIVSLGIAVYSGYQKKNGLLLALLAVWGLTGIKSLPFHAYEDIILLICGIYAVILLWKSRNPTNYKIATGT